MAPKKYEGLSDADYNVRVNDEIPYLDDNSDRLVITAPAQSALVSAKDKLTNPTSGWNYYYQLTLTPGGDITENVNAKNAVRDQLSNLLFRVFQDIPHSALTSHDRTRLHIL